jgi:hypothetical protein
VYLTYSLISVAHCINTDQKGHAYKNFVLSATPSSTLSNWVELATPNSVTSVNSLYGPNVTLTSDNISEGATNLYFTTSRARSAISATSPLSYNASTGTISMTTASASNNGYLTATDFTTFNNKQNALTAEVDYVTPSNFETITNSISNSIASNSSSITSLNTSVNAATNTNTASTIVKRDASGNFSAGTITAALSGNATTASSAGNITATSNSTLVTISTLSAVGTITSGTISLTTDIKTAGKLVAGNVTYPNIHGNSGQVLTTTGSGTLTWSTASVPADASTSSKGMIQLTGDLGGTASSPTVNSIGGVSSSTIGNFDTRINTVSSSVTSNTSSITSLNTSVNAATNTNTVNTIVKRDASGNFSAGTITAALLGNASTATTATTAGNITATSNSTLVTISTLSAVGTLTSGTISLTTDIKTAGKLVAGNVTYPNTHGATGQLLSTTGSGTLTWTSGSSVNIFTDEPSSITAGQTSFNLSNIPLSNKVWMYINGTRISKNAYSVSVSGTTASVTYVPSSNNGYTLIVGDRIQFDYVY